MGITRKRKIGQFKYDDSQRREPFLEERGTWKLETKAQGKEQDSMLWDNGTISRASRVVGLFGSLGLPLLASPLPVREERAVGKRRGGV